MRMERGEVVESASNLLLEMAARERWAERQVEHFLERSPEPFVVAIEPDWPMAPNR